MDLFRGLAVLAEVPGRETGRLAELLGLGARPTAEDYTELFVFQLYPYASVYLGAEGQLGGEARDRIAGFWRALGLDVPAEPDHLAALLGLYAAVSEREVGEDQVDRRLGYRRARHALLWEHLLSWLPPWLWLIREGPSRVYSRWAGLLADALVEEASAVGPPATLPLHLREAPGLPPSDAGAGEWLGALLAPVRSGMIVTRADLGRGARALGFGLRAGERRFSLRALIQQDPPATLAWLAAEARTWATRHAGLTATGGAAISTWWSARAEATAASLEMLVVER